MNARQRVTIFGDGSRVDHDITQELANWGASAEIVTDRIGWPEAVKFAVARIDTAAGEAALRDLASQESPSTRVLCTCGNPQTLEVARAIRTICVQCSDQNLVTLLWHPAIGSEIRSNALASVVAREYMSARRDRLVEQSVVLDPEVVREN